MVKHKIDQASVNDKSLKCFALIYDKWTYNEKSIKKEAQNSSFVLQTFRGKIPYDKKKIHRKLNIHVMSWTFERINFWLSFTILPSFMQISKLSTIATASMAWMRRRHKSQRLLSFILLMQAQNCYCFILLMMARGLKKSFFKRPPESIQWKPQMGN